MFLALKTNSDIPTCQIFKEAEHFATERYVRELSLEFKLNRDRHLPSPSNPNLMNYFCPQPLLCNVSINPRCLCSASEARRQGRWF